MLGLHDVLGVVESLGELCNAFIVLLLHCEYILDGKIDAFHWILVVLIVVGYLLESCQQIDCIILDAAFPVPPGL